MFLSDFRPDTRINYTDLNVCAEKKAIILRFRTNKPQFTWSIMLSKQNRQGALSNSLV